MFVSKSAEECLLVYLLDDFIFDFSTSYKRWYVQFSIYDAKLRLLYTSDNVLIYRKSFNDLFTSYTGISVEDFASYRFMKIKKSIALLDLKQICNIKALRAYPDSLRGICWEKLPGEIRSSWSYILQLLTKN